MVIGWMCLAVVIFGVIKWKTDWLDSDPEEKFKQGSEAYYISKLGKELNGETEVKVDGGRIDILTDDYAIEVERAHNWKNGIGQSLWYAYQKNRKAKIILLVEGESQDEIYFQMLNSVIEYNQLPIEVELEMMRDN